MHSTMHSTPTTTDTVPQDCGDDERIWHLRLRKMIISDGLGGILVLDILQDGLDDLASACTALLVGTPLAPGAYLARVRAGNDIYLLRQVKNAPNNIGITRVGSPAQDVSLTEEMARLVVGLIEQTQPLRASVSARPT